MKTNCGCDSELKFLSNVYTNPKTNSRTLTTLKLTLTDPHDSFESICAPIFCDFTRNYFGALNRTSSHFVVFKIFIVEYPVSHK